MHWRKITIWLPVPHISLSLRFTIRTILVCMLLIAIVCAVITRPVPTASAIVSFPKIQSANPRDVQQFYATQVELVKGAFVVGAAIRQLDETDLPEELRAADWVAARLKVTPQTNIALAEVSISSSNATADQLQAIVDSVVKAYESEVVSVRKNP